MKYSDEFKQKVLKYLKNHTKTDTMKQFNISVSTLYCWIDPEYKKRFYKKVSKRLSHKLRNDSTYRRIWNTKYNSNRKDNPLSKELVDHVHKVFEDKCAICNNTKDLQYDHWIPYSKGGKLTKDNTILLCSKCNSSKSNHLPKDYLPEDVYTSINNKLKGEGV